MLDHATCLFCSAFRSVLAAEAAWTPRGFELADVHGLGATHAGRASRRGRTPRVVPEAEAFEEASASACGKKLDLCLGLVVDATALGL